MDRRWRGQQGQAALKSLQSFYEYRNRLPALAGSQQCASSADIYSTYSCLHAAGRETVPLCSPKQDLIYLQVQGKPEVRGTLTRQAQSHRVAPQL